MAAPLLAGLEFTRVVEYGFLAVIAGYAFTGLVAPLWGPRATRLSLYAATMVALAAALYASLAFTPAGGYVVAFDGAVVVDTYTVFLLSIAVVVFALAAIAASSVVDYWDSGEAFYAVTGFMALGVIVLGLSRILYLVYVAWILAAVSGYILIALRRGPVSAEASIKYAVTGAVATIILLLDLVLFYVVRGGAEIAPGVRLSDPLFITPVVALAIVAVGFKMGVVPFHGWVVDVYGNARPLAVAVASAAAKIIAALLIVKLVAPFTAAQPEIVLWTAGILAAITMFYGNIGALLTVRDSPQKTLAYSSIAQASYIVAGFAALAKLPGVDNHAALAGIALHTAGYAFAKLASFLVLDTACESEGKCTWNSLRGLAFRNPVAAAALIIALAALAGTPPTLGFWGKLYLLIAAVSASPVLAAIMVINFGLGIFYYGYTIYAVATGPRQSGEKPTARDVAALAAAVSTVILGLAPWEAYGLTVYAYTST
ncbi:NADH-quinone oxidoreductase subunit N [Pyrodictium abyssi]|uniref:F(420)H(2) dehydrogenase subunit N n=1 Tax=Pyrodictium abyssi TaxID=54256 RepID=A0ABM8IZV9_9CREN|nr:F(420)H(2) dehydrogenase subunit N [Pyrodictium abyssi]